MFLPIPAIGSIVFSPSALIASHPAIAYEVIGHTLGNVLYGFLKRNRRRRGLSRSQVRKVNKRRHRYFVDNIIMHHQRLAQINRQIIVSNARERAMMRREKIKQQHESKMREKTKSKQEDVRKRWQQGKSLKERGKEIRGNNDARRIRARSRWLTIANQKN